MPDFRDDELSAPSVRRGVVDQTSDSRQAADRAAQIRRAAADLRRRVAAVGRRAEERIARSTTHITRTHEALRTSAKRMAEDPDR